MVPPPEPGAPAAPRHARDRPGPAGGAEETTAFRRIPSAGPYRPLPPGSPPPERGSPGARRRPGLIGALVEWVSDVPVKVVYGLAAALVTVLVIFLIFLLFSGDQPAEPAGAVPPASSQVSGMPAQILDAGAARPR